MKPVTRLLVERLRRGLLSRNRHFALFREPDARNALRIHHLLRSLERDLRGADATEKPRLSIHHHEVEDAVTIRIEMPSQRAVRTCRLSRAELRLLLQNPELRELLEATEG